MADCIGGFQIFNVTWILFPDFFGQSDSFNKAGTHNGKGFLQIGKTAMEQEMRWELSLGCGWKKVRWMQARQYVLGTTHDVYTFWINRSQNQVDRYWSLSERNELNFQVESNDGKDLNDGRMSIQNGTNETWDCCLTGLCRNVARSC